LSRRDIAAADANDPLIHGAALLISAGLLTPNEVLQLYEDTERTVARVAEEAISRPKLLSREQILASLIPPKRAVSAPSGPSLQDRTALFGGDLPSMDQPQHMARLLNWAMADLMLEHPQIVIAGEDVGAKGGVYYVTAKLQARFGPTRVINTLLDEQSILGLGIGLAHNGFLPILEIQFLAYLHNAEDQLRGEASTLSFFSNGQYTNPMIVRVAGLGYQKGFGGHFHNDNSLAVLRDIPGLIIACPSNGRDAVGMIRECVRLAREEQRVVVFVEPIALYMTRDLHAEKDGLWTFPYDAPGVDPLRLGEVGLYGDGEDLAIVTYANGYYLSRQAQPILAERHRIRTRIVDLRWIAPLPERALLDAIRACRRVLIVDECRITGSQSEGLMALLMERAPWVLQMARVAAVDSFIPLARAATLPLPSRDEIIAAALSLVGSCAGEDRSA
jgi:2-oxoisovalerate dehydrogenase E1 component